MAQRANGYPLFAGVIDIEVQLNASLPQGEKRIRGQRQPVIAPCHENAAEHIGLVARQRRLNAQVVGDPG